MKNRTNDKEKIKTRICWKTLLLANHFTRSNSLSHPGRCWPWILLNVASSPVGQDGPLVQGLRLPEVIHQWLVIFVKQISELLHLVRKMDRAHGLVGCCKIIFFCYLFSYRRYSYFADILNGHDCRVGYREHVTGARWRSIWTQKKSLNQIHYLETQTKSYLLIQLTPASATRGGV